MSDKKELDVAVETPKVVISGEDCKAAADFWKHFEIPMPVELESALNAFEKDPTIRNQDEVKFHLCKAMVESNHEAFKDEVFTKILEECSQVTYQMAFERDLESTLSDKEEKK